jgi:NAD(P)-dependent dehydrogenase (short-subunit alcohol dehydrogenase family)
MKIDLDGRVVLVTGASKGIGRAIALGAAQAGADVVVNYCTDEAGADAVVARVGEWGRRAVAMGADVGRVTEIREMFERVRKEFGRLDVLVNNAAITVWTDLFDATEEQWDRCLSVNLKGTFFCAVEAARLMRMGGGGSIVNISTNCAAMGLRNLSIYAASKGGVHALTKHLAVELAPYGIRVNTFGPGPTRVERNLADDPDYDTTWGRMVPMQRTAAPEEMIGPALFLASEQSSFVTGQLFYADGGWTVFGKQPGFGGNDS